MDCEKFDLFAIDALYAELDELTNAALKRHMDGCARCSRLMSGFRATRAVGLLPVEEPSDDLEERILAAADAAQRKAPWHKRAVRLVAWAGSHAMRPQLAAAAVLLIILGSSVLLLRPKPGSMSASPVSVTERGVPAPDPDADRAPSVEAQAANAPPPPALAATAEALASAAPPPMATAAAPLEKMEAAKGAADTSEQANAVRALADARAQRDTSGCRSALGGFDKVGANFPGSPQAADAMWDAATCYKSMGDGAKAHELFMALASSSKYHTQASQELAQAAAATPGNQLQAAGGPAAAGPARAAAAAKMPAAAPPPMAAPVAADKDEAPGGAPRMNSAPAKKPATSF